jgi:hypothetical protein
MVQTINSVADRCASIGLVLPLLWLDAETYAGANLTPDELQQALAQCDALGIPAGIYTSREMWRRVGNPTGFEDRPVWTAEYNGVPDLASVMPVPNLPRIVGHQWQGDPLDKSVMERAYTMLLVEPAPDPCEDQERRLAAVRAIADRKPYRAPSRRVLRAALDALP